MNKVLVIFIADDSLKASKISLENLNVINVTKEPLDDKDEGEVVTQLGGYEVDFFILDLTKKLSKDFSSTYKIIETDSDSLYIEVNNLLSQSSLDLFCIIPSSFFVEKDFLFHLVISYLDVYNSGVIGIASELNCIEYSYALCNDEDFNKSIIYTDNVKGLLFFSRYILESIGFFDTSGSVKGDELSQYCFRSHLSGFNNYYIDNCVASYPKLIISDNTKVQNSLDKMRQSNNYYIHFSTI
jgi:hypothetical protein